MIIWPNDMTVDDCEDIYLEIMAAATRCQQLVIRYLYIPGHQDTKANQPLTIQEQHNVECDQLAKQFVLTHHQKSTTYDNPAMDAARTHLLIDGKVICHHFLPVLRQAAASPDYMEYLRIRFTWAHADTRMVSWMTLNLALRSFSHPDQHRLILFIHDKLLLCASKFHPHLGSTLCPSCQRETENYWHFLECDQIERRTLFMKLKMELNALAVKYCLHPNILTTFWLGLLAIHSDTPYPQIKVELLPALQHVFHSQTRLGWDQLYHGRVSSTWEKAIDAIHPQSPLSG